MPKRATRASISSGLSVGVLMACPPLLCRNYPCGDAECRGVKVACAWVTSEDFLPARSLRQQDLRAAQRLNGLDAQYPLAAVHSRQASAHPAARLLDGLHFGCGPERARRL